MVLAYKSFRCLALSAVFLATVLLLGCQPKANTGSDLMDAANTQNPDASVTNTDGGGSQVDRLLTDSSNPYQYDGGGGDGCPPEMQSPCPNPIQPGCVGQEVCGNGLDDDCNGEVDDTCLCEPGSVQPCFLGPPNMANVGACTMGTQTCQGGEFAKWGPCVGGIWPSPEICDDLDNDCNGCVDDGLCCSPPISCPDPTQIAEAHPFVPYQLDGTQWYSGPANSWSWTIEGGPCDTLLNNASFEITGGTTATPTIDFSLSGDYTVTMTVNTPSGTYTCVFVVHVIGPGLRVELCWEGTGFRDIDLHLLRQDFGVPWCADQDCYYMNCDAEHWDHSEWGYAASPLAECVGSPNGAEWQSRYNSCMNPRLDIDNIVTPGIPENINVDDPVEGQTFRVMVHYFSGFGQANPLINIYCDGHRIATYGQAPDQLGGVFTTSGGYGCQGHTWRVADVVTHVNGGVTTCDVLPLHPGGQTTGYRVLSNDTTY